jgi:hypothetical protein
MSNPGTTVRPVDDTPPVGVVRVDGYLNTAETVL